MLKVLCINSNTVNHPNGAYSTGNGLVEGETYTVVGNSIYTHPNNKKPCYLIAELDDLKLVSRFIPVSDIDEVMLKEEEVSDPIQNMSSTSVSG